MTKLELPTVTMVCADCLNAERAVVVLEKCKAVCNFGAVKLFTSLPTDYPHIDIRPLNSLNDYSAFMMKTLHEYVDTPHMLTVQHDGWVLSPHLWEPIFLDYDYIGPLFLQEQTIDDWTVGSGGFSLRSKALMAAVASFLPPWDGHSSYQGDDGRNNWAHEDGVICKHLRPTLLNKGFKFAPPAVAARFAYGGNNYQYCPTPFGFHGFWPNINFESGFVASSSSPA